MACESPPKAWCISPIFHRTRGLYGTYAGFRTESRSDRSTVRIDLPALLDQRVDREAPIGIAGGADGHTRRNLILPLNRLALGRGHVGRKSNKEIAGDALLDRDVGSR